MAIDFKALVSNRPALRPVADFSQVQVQDVWSGWKPNTSNSSVKGALSTIRNAPVSSGWWEGTKAGLFEALQNPYVKGTLNTLDVPRSALAQQWGNWTDGTLDWGDVPGMHNIIQGAQNAYNDDKRVTTDTLMTRAGWENQDGWQWGNLSDNLRDVLSFTGDVASDPLTYLTFGAGSSIKAAGTAGVQAAGDAALQAGLKAGLQRGTPQLTRYVDDTLTKAAQAKANNQMIGLNLPFGPEATLVNKPGLLKIKDQKIGQVPSQDLAKRMADLGMQPAERYQFASTVFQRPISSFKELTTQEFDHMWNLLDNGMDRGITKLKDAQVDQALNSPSPSILDDINASHGLDAPPIQTLPGLEELAQKASASFRQFDGAAGGMSQLGQLLKQNPVSEGIGNLLGGRRYVAPSVQATDHRIGQAVNTLEDARMTGYSNARAKIDEIEKLNADETIKMLTPEERSMLPYVIEGQWPKSINPADIPAESMSVMENAAAVLREYAEKFTKEELDAGIEYTVRDNYFPHMLDIPKTPDDFNALVTKLGNTAPELAQRLTNAPKGFTRERKAFQSMAEIRDMLDAHKGNKDVENFLGSAVFDPVEAFGRRAMQGAHEVARRQAFKEMERIGVAKKLPKDGKIPNGWTKIDIPGLENSIVPTEVEKRLNSINKILTNDARLNKIASKADGMYAIWRRNATVTGAGFHVRQIIGNIFQNALAGVTLGSYKTAAKVLTGKGSVKIGGQTLPAETIIKEAMEDGILGTGSSSDFLSSLTKDLGNKLEKGNPLQKINPMSKDFVPGKLGQKASEYEDNISRLAHYIFARQKGATRKIAKDSVIKHLFDYSNISTPERALRAVFPFYTWMRNNIPFQIAQAVKRPGLYNVISDLQSAMQDEPELEPLLDELGINRPEDREMMRRLVQENGGVLPDYIQERFINVGGNNYFNVGLPSSDLEAIQNPVDMAYESMNPLLQWFNGIATNRNSFGQPIDRYSEDDSVGALAGLRYTMDQFGGNPGRALGNLIPDAAGNTRLSDAGLLGGIGKMLGISTTEVDPLQALKSLLYQERDAALKRRQKEKAMSE